MKNLSNLQLSVWLIVCMLSVSLVSFAQTTKTIGGVGAHYPTLKAAFDDINNGTVTGIIVLQITGNTSESSTATLNAGGGGSANYTSILIYPTISGLAISGNLGSPLIDLNGADNVTIDGRVGASGSSKDLIITNTFTGTTASTIRFINSAENNSIKYCIIKGSETSTASGYLKGIVFFSLSSSGNGNDGNTIDNNTITSDDAGRATHAIFSQGSPSIDNSNNTISNNCIYNFLNPTLASYGIHIYINSSDWTISGNSFYETTTFTPGASVAYSILKIENTSGINFTITGNYFGGSTTNCGGSAWNKSNAYDNVFFALNLSVGTSVISNIQNNTIKNFSWSNSSSASWTGISISAGAVNIGTTTANTIGANTGIGSISVTGGAAATNVYGINLAGSGTIRCQNNIIGSITGSNSNSAYSTNIFAINRTCTGVTTISSNLIGSTSQANSIQSSSISSANAQSVIGIYNTTGGTITASSNTIANLTNGTTNTDVGTAGLIDGIASSYGINVITNNSIYNLSIANANTSATQTASVCGIAVNSTNSLNTITGNTIYNLSNTYLNFNGSVIGLYFGSTGMYTTNSHLVTNNFIHSLMVTGASSSGANIYGIKIYTGQTSYINNIISLGGNTNTNLYGIFETGTSSNNNNLYFNTIYIAGVPTSGTSNSYALYSAVSTNTRNFRNNILVNARSNNGAAAKHYAAYFNYGVSTALTLDYNDYYVSGTGGVLGNYNGSDVVSLPLISGLDAKSLSINPSFSSAGGTLAANYKPTSDKLEGVTITTVTTDYSSLNRASTPTIGAYEVTLNLNIDVYKSGVFLSSYSTLKDAFSKINNGTHTGILEIRIKANTTETGSAVLYQSGYTSGGLTSNYSSIKIFPVASGLSISGNFDASVVDLNGADNVVIDGRVNELGSLDLVIKNTAVSTYASALKLSNSSINNILKYCKIYSSCNNSGVGGIYFGSSASGNGNDNNIVEYCNISNSGGNRPSNALFSSGGNGRENSGNSIRYNNFFDFFNPGISSNGINISYNSTDWTISGNSFYETTTFVPTGSFTYCAIRVSTTSPHLISGNYIGGSAALCGGSAWTLNSNRPFYFCMAYLTGGSSSPCVFQNNILKNVSLTSTEDNPWDGIFINAGNVTVSGNTIGATTGNGSITLTTPLPSASVTLSGGAVSSILLNGGGSGYSSPPIISFSLNNGGSGATATANITGGVVTSITLTNGGSGYTSTPSLIFDGQSNNYSTSHGIINAGSGTVTISNNTFGSITIIGSTTYSHGFETVYNRGLSGTTTFSNNLVGSLSTTNSIYLSSTAANSLQKQDLYGFYNANGGTAIISGNTFANLTNAYSGTNSASRIRPIATTSGTNTIQNNIIRDISSNSAQASGGTSASIIGISQSSTTSGTTQTISGNTIYNLNNTNPTAATLIYGIYYSGPTSGTHSVTKNFIHSFSFSSSNIACEMDGITFYNGLTTCANNIINLGVSSTLGYKMYGICDNSGATNRNKIYFNSVYIGGTVSSGITSSTGALWNVSNTSTRIYRNNILYNARMGGTSGKHYSIYISGTAGLTLNNNDYFVAGGTLGKLGISDKTDLTAWKAGTNQDANSVSVNPSFTIAGGTSAFDYYTSASLLGVSISGITTDYDGLTRGASPKMGALEYNNFTWQGTTSSNFGTAANWSGGVVPPDGANIIFASTPSNHCVLDVNRTIKNITNAQSTMNFVLNGKRLTLTGDLIFSNSAKIDATTSLSSIVFGGSSAQSIPTNSFVSNTIDTLTINNVNGLSLNGDFTINKGIALISGNFAIGPNTLTFNGVVTEMTGSVTGGSSTNMIIGGTGSTINMPNFLLNNLTINRASGVTMYGDVNLVGALTLTSGTLTVGANTLTLSGASISRTSGNIDASDASATIIFDNSSPISLPASIFSTAVNNLTLSGVGGLTSISDFTVNGELNLAVANPSATKGLLDLKDGSSLKTLTMGADATTSGIGDVTGIVKRNSFISNIDYSFGNHYTTMTFNATGTLPTDVSFKIIIGSAPAWKTNAVQRTYDIIRTGGSTTNTVTLSLHYLDAEIQANTESDFVTWDLHTSQSNKVEEHGKANQNTSENWIAISNRRITYFDQTFDTHPWAISNKESANFTWQGTPSSDWNDPNNWSGGIIPSDTSDVIIPDASSTLHDPVLTDSTDYSVKTIIIEAGGILEGGLGTTLTITGSTGAWYNIGTFNAGTSTIIFTNANATMADPTNFYNVTIANGASLTPENNNIMRISGALTLSGTGILRAALLPNTIEFNGDNQTIINPNGLTTGYYNLILSGTGIKTMPASALSIAGDFTISGTASTTALNTISFGGNFVVDNGATFNTGVFSHSIHGNFDNNGIVNISSGNTITMNGSLAQTIGGSNLVDFDNLVIDNLAGVTLVDNENETNTLTLSNGNFNIGSTTFGINGSITKLAGFINVTTLSSLIFGGSSSYTIPNNLFFSPPSLNNLKINRSGGVSLGNQDITINGLLELTSGILTIGSNKITIAGVSPVKTSGSINVNNPYATIEFTNANPIILPASFFDGTVNDLIVNAVGGITAVSDFTISGILHLQSSNPSSTKGSLDMVDGSTTKTLTMGASATTIGVGDVTGIIKRTTINAGTTYTFGSQFMTAYFSNIGTLPSQMSAKISIGTEPSWKLGALQREIEIIQTGGSGTSANFSYHYLESELNGNDEEHMVLWVKYGNTEYGRSSFDASENWISLTNVNVAFFSSTWDGTKNITLDEYSDNNTLTWNGSVSTSWTSVENWTPNAGPSAVKNLIIPDASTTPNSPILPSISEIKTLTIDAGGILNSSAAAQLTINGASAWINNGGIFNANTSTVIFTNTSATLSGTTNFYNVTLNTDKSLWLTDGAIMRIAGSFINNGDFHAVISGTSTVEYNGVNQSVIIPNQTTHRYDNLILSGSGTKTLPSSALNIVGDFTISGNASTTAAEVLTINGDFNIDNGTSFNTGGYNLSVGGNFNNQGCFVQNSGSIEFNGSEVQEMSGSSTFYNLLMNNNSTGLVLNNDITIANQIRFTNGDINLNGNILTLDENASLDNESNDKRIFGTSGYIQTSRNYGLGDLSSGVNIANMGLEITTTKSLGTITLKRGHEIFTGGNSGTGKSIARYFDYIISAKGNSDLNATLKMYYFENELNGLSESDLVQFQTSDNTNWTVYEVTTVDIIDNYIYTTGVDSLKKTTISVSGSSSNALPINLLGFNVTCGNLGVNINWTTVSESNCEYFIIEKSLNLIDFESIAKISATGNSNVQIEYAVIDYSIPTQKVYYRLKAVDFDGKIEIFKPKSISCFKTNKPSVLILPNPILDKVSITFGEDFFGEIVLKIFNAEGRTVHYQNFHLSNQTNFIQININNLPAGIYTFQLNMDGKIFNYKLLKI